MHGNANGLSRLSSLEAKYCFKVEVQNVLREEEIVGRLILRKLV